MRLATKPSQCLWMVMAALCSTWAGCLTPFCAFIQIMNIVRMKVDNQVLAASSSDSLR